MAHRLHKTSPVQKFPILPLFPAGRRQNLSVRIQNLTQKQPVFHRAVIAVFFRFGQSDHFHCDICLAFELRPDLIHAAVMLRGSRRPRSQHVSIHIQAVIGSCRNAEGHFAWLFQFRVKTGELIPLVFHRCSPNRKRFLYFKHPEFLPF